MARSTRLRTRDLRNLYQLLGECCELGADPIAWREHLSGQLPSQFGFQVVHYLEVKVVATPFRELHWARPLYGVAIGYSTPSDRKPLEAHLEKGRPEDCPCITPDWLQRTLKVGHWSSSPDRSAYLQTMFFNEHVKPSHLDDGMTGHHTLAPGHIRWLSVARALGDRIFSQRECRLMKLLNLELARLLGKKLARIGEPSITDLPPRQRDVLVALMEGDSERQAALRLGISHHTVHDYVKMLHTRFGVRSRGELLARCRAFWPVLQTPGQQPMISDRNGRPHRKSHNHNGPFV